jgi:hypothetical protein
LGTRKQLVRERTSHIQYVQRTLEEANIPWPSKYNFPGRTTGFYALPPVTCTNTDENSSMRFREIGHARCIGRGGGLLELNGEPDDVHLRIALPPNLDLSTFVNTLKTTSSRLLRVFFGAKVY